MKKRNIAAVWYETPISHNLTWQVVIRLFVNNHIRSLVCNLVCNYTRDKQIGLLLCGRPLYDWRPNWTPLSRVTITNNVDLKSV